MPAAFERRHRGIPSPAGYLSPEESDADAEPNTAICFPGPILTSFRWFVACRRPRLHLAELGRQAMVRLAQPEAGPVAGRAGLAAIGSASTARRMITMTSPARASCYPRSPLLRLVDRRRS